MKKLIAFVILAFWPLNLFLNSGKQSFPLENFTKTIFQQDYQAEQRILEKINLYPTVFLARVYQNKARIYLDKASYNLLALTDLNNYFFGFHPRQIIGNQNLKKFPFVSIIFFLAGLYFFNRLKHKKLILQIAIPSLVYLTLLENFDRIDILLWLPMSLIILGGLDIVSRSKYWKYTASAFWIFTVPQLLRIFLGYQ
ncbi:MAG: Uncharacterized protein G01um10145_676 [Microgenomates group bacterium Gr01-1014_5]|nr:MAG: Uncharacterized protein G01um10145_676 [Microgenomates group bacterium Gr01-1014_5]